jgi:hypothetical protein
MQRRRYEYACQKGAKIKKKKRRGRKRASEIERRKKVIELKHKKRDFSQQIFGVEFN